MKVNLVNEPPGRRNASPSKASDLLVSLLQWCWHGSIDLLRKLLAGAQESLGKLESKLTERKLALVGISITRMLIGAIALGLLAANYSTRLYSFGPGSAWNGEINAPQSELSKLPIIDAFRLASGDGALYTFLYMVVMVLAALLLLGWRTRPVLIVFAILWVSFIEANDLLGDQGDNMYRIILVLLIFTNCSSCFSLDSRRRGRRSEPESTNSRSLLSTLFHNLAIIVLACQVFFVYVAGALYKAGGAPWQDGTAIYAPLATERFGTWPWLSELVTSDSSVVAILTWASLLLQMSFPFMLLAAPTRRIALVGIWGFHIGIGVLMGLPWFSLTMIAVDFIFVRDASWRKVGTWLRSSPRRFEVHRSLRLQADGVKPDSESGVRQQKRDESTLDGIGVVSARN
ncbi:HTTM domain-containing protein [Microbacterium sp. ANT_H45B]|nr:HTTM domain-containing protein [Microbacterium sp. ANT_H45B]